MQKSVIFLLDDSISAAAGKMPLLLPFSLMRQNIGQKGGAPGRRGNILCLGKDVPAYPKMEPILGNPEWPNCRLQTHQPLCRGPLRNGRPLGSHKARGTRFPMGANCDHWPWALPVAKCPFMANPSWLSDSNFTSHRVTQI